MAHNASIAGVDIPKQQTPAHSHSAFYVTWHTGKESLQRRITHFVSSGGGGSGAQQLDAFYRRLESTKEADLPCSIGKVQLSLSVASAADPQQDDDGHHQQQQQGFMAGHSAGSSGVTEVREDWLVCNQLGGGEARAMALQAWRKEKVKMIPWVGVATHLATHVSTMGHSTGARSLSCTTSTAGRAFCFLPLPADTSLPVHINGYFELSSNRCVLSGCRGLTMLIVICCQTGCLQLLCIRPLPRAHAASWYSLHSRNKYVEIVAVQLYVQHVQQGHCLRQNSHHLHRSIHHNSDQVLGHSCCPQHSIALKRTLCVHSPLLTLHTGVLPSVALSCASVTLQA